MVGLVTDYDDLVLIVIMVVFAPFTFVFGIAFFLSSLGASTGVIWVVSLLNTALVIYLLIHWKIIQSLGEALQDFLNTR